MSHRGNIGADYIQVRRYSPCRYCKEYLSSSQTLSGDKKTQYGTHIYILANQTVKMLMCGSPVGILFHNVTNIM